MKRILILLPGLLLFTGCETPPVSYYYGQYSQTLYRSKKDNSPASMAKHRHTLEDIIQKSEKKGLRVPPGIYCEYAYLLLKEGDPNADRYFALEVHAYPESERFVSFIRTQISKSTSP